MEGAFLSKRIRKERLFWEKPARYLTVDGNRAIVRTGKPDTYVRRLTESLWRLYTMKKKNLVIIGYGGMGSWHVGHAQKSDCVNLLGIYDIKEERRALAVENGIHTYSSLEELLADKEVEIVTIAIPNDQHMPVAIKALAAGKHVICEKPVTLSSDELQKIFDAAEKYGRAKTEAAELYFDDIDKYIEHKTPCIEELYRICGLM